MEAFAAWLQISQLIMSVAEMGCRFQTLISHGASRKCCTPDGHVTMGTTGALHGPRVLPRVSLGREAWEALSACLQGQAECPPSGRKVMPDE